MECGNVAVKREIFCHGIETKGYNSHFILKRIV